MRKTGKKATWRRSRESASVHCEAFQRSTAAHRSGNSNRATTAALRKSHSAGLPDLRFALLACARCSSRRTRARIGRCAGRARVGGCASRRRAHRTAAGTTVTAGGTAITAAVRAFATGRAERQQRDRCGYQNVLPYLCRGQIHCEPSWLRGNPLEGSKRRAASAGLSRNRFRLNRLRCAAAHRCNMGSAR